MCMTDSDDNLKMCMIEGSTHVHGRGGHTPLPVPCPSLELGRQLLRQVLVQEHALPDGRQADQKVTSAPSVPPPLLLLPDRVSYKNVRSTNASGWVVCSTR